MDKIYGTIAIMGRPNAGKSSLFNRFCKSRIAITSEIAGTTRDVKKANVTLKDTPFLLLDTGGLDESDSLFVQVT
ncbi:MAG: GTPase, partial [Helicobacter sp.]